MDRYGFAGTSMKSGPSGSVGPVKVLVTLPPSGNSIV